MRRLRGLVAVVAAGCPWRVRKFLLGRIMGYDLAPGARVGIAVIAVDQLSMESGSSIDHGTVIRGLSAVTLGEKASIGRLNWISATPVGDADFFAASPNRRPELVLGAHAAITHRHLIDCTDLVALGAFSTLAGYRSQVLTHSIDIEAGRQQCRPIEIGEYSFVGTGCTILGGAVLPAMCVLAAGGVLISAEAATFTLYAGVPARAVKVLPETARYFARGTGVVQ